MVPVDLDVLVPAGVEDLVPTFMDNRRKELDALHRAAAAGDMEAILNIAHRMKGVGEPYGFLGVSTLGAEFHRAADQGDGRTLVSLVARYATYLREVRVSFEEA